MIEEIINNIKRDIGPLKIIISSELVDHIYYLVIDGSHTYPIDQYWYEKWGKSFTGFIVMCLKQHLHKTVSEQDIETITNTKIKVKLGTVFDFVKEPM
jgi:hypothetical protein